MRRCCVAEPSAHQSGSRVFLVRASSTIYVMILNQGPPNAQKTPVSSSTSGLGAAPPGETSYELLLQQQQLFLQWQLEWQHKVVSLTLGQHLLSFMYARNVDDAVSSLCDARCTVIVILSFSPIFYRFYLRDGDCVLFVSCS